MKKILFVALFVVAVWAQEDSWIKSADQADANNNVNQDSNEAMLDTEAPGGFIPTLNKQNYIMGTMWNGWFKGLNVAKLAEFCSMDRKSHAFDNKVDKLMASSLTNLAGAGALGPTVGAPGGVSTLADSANPHSVAGQTPDAKADAAKKALVGERSLPMPARSPTAQQKRDAMVQARVASPKKNGLSRQAALDVSHRVDMEDEDEDESEDSYKHGMHYSTAHHAIKRINKENNGDMLFEGYEHESTKPAGALPHLPDSTLSLDNGGKVTYSQIIALAGDFYGLPDCPIAYGPIDKSKGGNSGDASDVASYVPPDGRELLVQRVYQHCGWDYKERVKTLLDVCPTENRGRVTAAERRFLSAFHTMNRGDLKELNRILDIFKIEHQRIRNMKTAVVDYLDIGNDINFKYALATGAKLKNYPRPLGTVPDGGRFMNLAVFNVDHFGDSTDNVPVRWNQIAYTAGHRAAIEMARQAKWSDDKNLLKKAYAMNAFADHFLTDQFSSGHMRPLRKALHDCCTVSSIGGSLPWGDLLSKFDHDEGNFHGLWLSSSKGGTWKAFGDKFWFASQNANNRAKAISAVQASIQEVANAFANPGDPENVFPSNMPSYFPAETRKSDNFKPLFRLSGNSLQIREPLDDAWNARPTYTGAFVGASSSVKLRYIAWEREYWYKAANPTPSSPDVDAARYFGSHDGVGTDEHTMLEILYLRSNEEIRALKNSYKRLYPSRDIVADTKSDTSGNFQKLLLVMLQAQKRAGPISSQDAARFARELKAAGEDKIGTDEDKFIDILGKNDFQSNGLVMDEYRKISKMTLAEAIKSEFSGIIRDTLVLLLPRPGMRVATSSTGGVLTTSSSGDSSSNNEANAIADQLNSGLDRVISDEAAIGSALRPLNNVKMQAVINAYEGKYSKALRGHIESKTSGWAKSALVQLMATNKKETPITDAIADGIAVSLYNAGENKWGTDEQVFVSNLCSQSVENVGKIVSAYQRKYNRPLRGAIDGEFSGGAKQAMLKCANLS